MSSVHNISKYISYNDIKNLFFSPFANITTKVLYSVMISKWKKKKKKSCLKLERDHYFMQVSLLTLS